MDIVRLSKEYISEAAAIFVQNYKKQRSYTPALPDIMESREHIQKMLGDCFDISSGLVALENKRVVGYLSWFLVNNFRGTVRKGAYVPEWGHGCIGNEKAKIYQAIYRVAAEEWYALGCHVHAITLLANDVSAEKAWFWNGFA
jgi:hypothetical protein